MLSAYLFSQLFVFLPLVDKFAFVNFQLFWPSLGVKDILDFLYVFVFADGYYEESSAHFFVFGSQRYMV